MDTFYDAARTMTAMVGNTDVRQNHWSWDVGRLALGTVFAAGLVCLPAPNSAMVVYAQAVVADTNQGDAAKANAAATTSDERPGEAISPASPPPARFEVRVSDGSSLKLILLDATIPLKTEYGTLAIPVRDVRRIDFATRVPEAAAERVRAAIAKLGDNEFKTREAATVELRELGEAAYPAVLQAVQSEDPEVVRRADLLLEQLRKIIPEDNLQIRTEDMIVTDKSQISGTIEIESLKVESAAFGRQDVKLVVLRRMAAPGEADPEPANVSPDPGTMANYQQQVGKTFYFRVTAPQVGLRVGAVWGSDIYTFDTHIASAAVHAGVLQPGQTKVVGVTMLGPQASFNASTRNGITSGAWGQYPSAYQFKTNKRPAGVGAPVPMRPVLVR